MSARDLAICVNQMGQAVDYNFLYRDLPHILPNSHILILKDTSHDSSWGLYQQHYELQVVSKADRQFCD